MVAGLSSVPCNTSFMLDVPSLPDTRTSCFPEVAPDGTSKCQLWLDPALELDA